MAQGNHSVHKRTAAHGASHKRPRSKAPVVILVLIVVAIAAGVGGFFACSYEQPAEVRTGEEITVDVPDGSSTNAIAKTLKDAGIIATTKGFTSRVSELGDENSLKSGTYRFTGGQDVDEIIADLVDGESGYWVTIPEGYTIKQISTRVEKATDGQIKASDFYKLAHTGAKRYEKSFPFLKKCYKGSMEGFLFPETYRVSLKAAASDVIVQMLSQFQSEISSVDLTYAKSKKLDEYDVTTLASIIEKESRTSDDKAGISAVFYNRLHEKMNLGSDVTTYYAVGKELTETLTKKDLASKSPYNTRNAKNKGLPPGAICNPGIEAIKAAANPDKDSENLYFFWSQSQGKTYFYKTEKAFEAGWKKYGK